MCNYKIKFLKTWTLFLCLGLLVALLSGCASQNTGRDTGGADASISQLSRITSIELFDATDKLSVVIKGNRPLTYTSVKQPLPLGVVLYFPDTLLEIPASPVQSDGTPVTSIEAGQIDGQKKTTRIEILLASDSSYDVVQNGDSLKIQFDKNSPSDTIENSTASPVKLTETNPSTNMPKTAVAVSQPTIQAKPTGIFQGTGSRVETDGQIWVNRIDFLGEGNGRSTLSIETTSAVKYELKKVSDNLLELRLVNANIAEFRQRPMITTRFESAVNRIMPIQLPSMKDFSLFSIELREPVAYYAEQTGTLLLIHFEASSVPPAPVNETNLPAWKKALEDTLGPAGIIAAYPEGKSENAGNIVSNQSTPSNVATSGKKTPEIELEADQAMVVTRKVKRYTGEKIALDFFQTDVKNVFRILREVSGKNFAIDKDVTGKVTMTLDKPVPWDQVMDLVLRMNQLGMVVEGDIVRIATLTTLKKENDLRKAQIASLQKEKEQVKSLEPLVTKYISVSYSDAGKEILPHIQNIITKGRGSVTVDEKNNQIILTDTAEKIAQAQEIARQIDKVTSQVVIEARVVEVNESYSKELGFSWNLGVGPVTIDNGGSQYNTSVAMNYPAATSNGFGLNYAKIAGTPFTLDATLTAIETNGHGKVLSAPKIVTLNNKQAKIKQGQEIGYLERDSAGGSSVKFKNVDLLLEVTPHVTPDNRISLNIVIKKNDVSSFVDGVPIISTNEAETQLLVNDGDTIVIGGIIKATSAVEKTAFPGLHKIPVLGWMFQRNLKDLDNNELLIFMNPKIVQLEQRSTVF